MKGEEQPLCSASKAVIPQPGLNLTGATTPSSPSSYKKSKGKWQARKKKIGMLTVNSVSAFPLSSVIELGATMDLCSMEAPPSCM
jgi:hypothetical protein